MNAIGLLLAAIVVLLSILTWQLVLTLRQARRAALAVEVMLSNTRPGIEASVDHLKGVLSRADRFTANVEQGGNRVGALFSGLSQAFTGGSRESAGAPSRLTQTLSALSALLNGIAQAWAAMSSPASAGPGSKPASGDRT